MKKAILFLSFMVAMVLSVVAQDSTAVSTTVTDVTAVTSTPSAEVGDNIIEETVFESIINGAMEFLGMINWLFVVVFIIVAWLMNDTAEATNGASWFSWWAKIPKVLRTLIAGVLLMGAFVFLFDYRTKPEITEMLFGIVMSMVIYKIGLDKFLRWISQKLGVKFE